MPRCVADEIPVLLYVDLEQWSAAWQPSRLDVVPPVIYTLLLYNKPSHLIADNGIVNMIGCVAGAFYPIMRQCC